MRWPMRSPKPRSPRRSTPPPATTICWSSSTSTTTPTSAISSTRRCRSFRASRTPTPSSPSRRSAAADRASPHGCRQTRKAEQTATPTGGIEMIMPIVKLAAIALAGTVAASAAVAQAKLPPTVTMTAYDTGTSGFNITVAIGKMMNDKYGTDARVLPAGNDVARLQPLRLGRATISAMGAGVYFAQEGVFEFATREWGPQAVQITLSSVDCNGLSLAIAGDAGAKTLADLKGKRVGFVVGSPALNQNALAMLAFANLTAKDVKIVEFASNNAMWKGAVNNDVDALFGSTIAGPAKELQTSPRGIVWPALPHDDKAGWARVRKVGPYFTEHNATCGAGSEFSKEKPIQIGTYPYPIYTVYGSQPEDEVYILT